MEEAQKILVVDDNRTIKMLLEKRLSAEGFIVVTAGDGREGLAAAAREMPDLILSDVDMPVMDGGEMVSQLKSSAKTSHIPVIFLTSLITKDESKRPVSG
jgi:two-component system cell cycle response regulator